MSVKAKTDFLLHWESFSNEVLICREAAAISLRALTKVTLAMPKPFLSRLLARSWDASCDIERRGRGEKSEKDNDDHGRFCDDGCDGYGWMGCLSHGVGCPSLSLSLGVRPLTGIAGEEFHPSLSFSQVGLSLSPLSFIRSWASTNGWACFSCRSWLHRPREKSAIKVRTYVVHRVVRT